MKFLLSLVVLLALTAGLAAADELKRLSLDDASTLGTTIQTDARIKAEGKGAVKIATRWPTTVCLGEVDGGKMDNARLVYRAKVRSELDGNAYLEMWVQVGGGEYFSRGMNNVVAGRSEWKTIQTPFFLQAGQQAEKVTLNLVVNGKGTVWIDEVVLAKEPL